MLVVDIVSSHHISLSFWFAEQWWAANMAKVFWWCTVQAAVLQLSLIPADSPTHHVFIWSGCVAQSDAQTVHPTFPTFSLAHKASLCSGTVLLPRLLQLNMEMNILTVWKKFERALQALLVICVCVCVCECAWVHVCVCLCVFAGGYVSLSLHMWGPSGGLTCFEIWPQHLMVKP